MLMSLEDCLWEELDSFCVRSGPIIMLFQKSVKKPKRGLNNNINIKGGLFFSFAARVFWRRDPQIQNGQKEGVLHAVRN